MALAPDRCTTASSSPTRYGRLLSRVLACLSLGALLTAMATPWVGYDTLNQARWLPELADGHLEFENLLVAVAVAVAVAGVVVGCDWVTMRGRSRHWVAVSLGLGAIVGSLVLCAAVPAGGVWVMYADAAGRMGELVLQPARHIGQYLFVAAGRQRC